MKRSIRYMIFSIIFFLPGMGVGHTQQSVREIISLNNDWRTIANDSSLNPSFSEKLDDTKWKLVDVPHNWDQYAGYRRLVHGNFHGDAWYRKNFAIDHPKNMQRFFLFFEGVGSYATVFLNGRKVGEHAGGRTSFTIDITDFIHADGKKNLLAVRAYHPASITDLPWVCGGCSEERGFSEGSQPFGLFRPVQLVITSDVRIEPFGLHAWSNNTKSSTDLNLVTTIKNYSALARSVIVINEIKDADGKMVTRVSSQQQLSPGDSILVSQKDLSIPDAIKWSPANPYLYKIETTIIENDIVLDRLTTDYGFRTINWRNPTNQFFINDQAVFINGIAEYEHLLGQSHAFSNEQVQSRMKWITGAGFNGFRDGHQPHNLLYGKLCNELGVLWWTQFSAHVWYDTPAFREQFKILLREWVIERRNDPSVVLWGLQNESKLPEDFANECTNIIRQLDPTASSQRLVTTCNGGSGTDWDVPQNWTGTYGGNPDIYDKDVKKQVLIGEYGAWRTIDLHTEGGFVQNGALSEDRMTLLMEQKIRLAESVRDSSAGQFSWLLTSHDNPGRVQGGEGLRELDRIGPVNYKGLLTPWEEPLDVFYMYQSNYAPKEKLPMVYIVSHTWPNRWTMPGKKDGIIVYSNCDEVELFNDMGIISLGRRKRNGIGTHFQWDGVAINYNVLLAKGYVNGKEVCSDVIVLNHLPKAPGFDVWFYQNDKNLTRPAAVNYLYRVNCGGPDYIDRNGNLWMADRARSKANSKTGEWFSSSWTENFNGLPSFFASQRRIFDPITNTRDWKLFQDFRYGKDQLQYEFPLPDGEYQVELYFIEPWLGALKENSKGMRLFDVAINGKTVINNLDIYSEVGAKTVLKKVIGTKVTGGKLVISFPRSAAGQAVISAIAISSKNRAVRVTKSPGLITTLLDTRISLQSWLDIGNRQYKDKNILFRNLPSNLFGATWLQMNAATPAQQTTFIVNDTCDVFVAVPKSIQQPLSWLAGFENTGTTIETDENSSTVYIVYRKRIDRGQQFSIRDARKLPRHIVAVVPVTHIQPAFDLKQLKSYRADVSIFSDGIRRDSIGGRLVASVKSNVLSNIEWPVQTGVADMYAITVKYFYGQQAPLKARLQLIGPGNMLLQDEEVTFNFTRPGKWNQLTLNTSSMINAGNYKVRIIMENASGLLFSGIELQ